MASITVGFLQPRPSPLIVSPTTFHQKQIPTTLFSKSLLHSSNTIVSSSISPLFSDRWRPSCATAESFEPESNSEPNSESTQIVQPDSEPAQLAEESSEVPKKGVEIFAVVMVSTRYSFYNAWRDFAVDGKDVREPASIPRRDFAIPPYLAEYIEEVSSTCRRRCPNTRGVRVSGI